MAGTEGTASSADVGSARALRGHFVLAVTVGGIIGLGILRSPGEVAAVVPDPFLYLALWLSSGLFVLLSIGVVAELVGMTPRSGGVYALVRHAYGPFSGFVIGWADWLSYCANIAVKAVVLMEFVAILFPATVPWATPLGIFVTTAFAVLQLRGIVFAASLQQTISAIVGFAVVGFSLLLFFADPVVATAGSVVPEPRTGLGAWSLVIATIIFTYDGWLYASYFSGEIQGGAGAVARSCIKGTVVVIVLYMLLNTAMVVSVPLQMLAGHELTLARALELAVSPTASAIVVVAAIVILLSHQNLAYMGAPRILHALASDGLAVKRAQSVGKGGNPVFAVLLTWILAASLIMIGGFESLIKLCSFLFVPLYIALISGVLILRIREPNTPRPFRAWGHPYSTVIVLIGWGIITVVLAVAERETALYAVAMVAVAWPAYRYLNKG